MLLLGNPRISLYTVRILYTIRAVVTALTANDRKKNAVTDGRYQLGGGTLSATLWIVKPRVVNVMTMIQN